ncbi:hypothetical protein Ahy_B03g066471 [Arachis hypogaea]|uniref:peptidylprolyl isomerase n=1 Tax=Arachis hypogaea TaxID=3818 RepID=A0A445A459_ARAHY|nr:hypothetical protein Ahy_B03g066471 [Arachis hypogaea]
MNMKKGEVALVTIHPEYAFGSSGSTQELATVLPNSNVYYEVELVSFVKVRENCLMFLMFYGSDNIKNNTNLIKMECRKRNVGSEYTREYRGSWKEEGRREYIVQGWQI